jgi:fucose 4-O-acetylase-like acetyltransferase
MIAMGVVCRLAAGLTSDTVKTGSNRVRRATILAAAGTALAVALVTPLLWTTWRPRWLPWPLESYINGVHTFNVPQPWLFPMFPWMAFALTGLAVGLALLSDWARRQEGAAVALLGAAGAALGALAWWLDAQPRQLYPVYDFWHTSPNFFLIRVGVLLVILFGTYAWCRWGAAQWGFSPMIQLGQTSLLVYWVHIEFVYGRFSILPKRAMSVRAASFGLLAIFLAMLLLSLTRTRLKGRGAEVLGWFRRPVRARQAVTRNS